MDFPLKKLKSLLKGKIVLICHQQADPDSICAAYAFQELSKNLNQNIDTTIFLPEGTSNIGKKVIKDLKIKTSKDFPKEKTELIVMLDVATANQLGKWSEQIVTSKIPKVFIDHHPLHPNTKLKSALFIVDEYASSTCEIIYDLFTSYSITPSKNTAKALLTGIAFDTKHFTIGATRTFKSIHELLETGVSLYEIFSSLKTIPERSEKIARLKSAQRMKIHQKNGWLISTTQIGSFQASAARGIKGLGADLVIAVAHEKGKIKASLRSTEPFYKETSIHLGKDMAIPLGKEFEGEGNGHSTAAGINCIAKPQAFLNAALKLIELKLDDR